MSNLVAEAPRDYSWAEYLHCMEGGSDVLTLPQKQPSKDSPLAGFAIVLLNLVPISYFLTTSHNF